VIIPTPDFDPLFADDGVAFRTKMLAYIRREFADLLGPRLALLESEEGVAIPSAPNNSEIPGSTARKAA
jgi:hypothetical protein